MRLENPEQFHGKLRSILIGMTLNTARQSDYDLYELMQYYNQTDILSENEYLLAMLREYIEQRFEHMPRDLILKYCTFLKDLGMLFQDKEMIMSLNGYFQKNYFEFELKELFEMMKLQSYCFYKTADF